MTNEPARLKIRLDKRMRAGEALGAFQHCCVLHTFGLDSSRFEIADPCWSVCQQLEASSGNLCPEHAAFDSVFVGERELFYLICFNLRCFYFTINPVLINN